MEPVGLAVGVLGLAGLFNNAVDCFEYVQISRTFGTQYQTSLLKLDASRLYLSRWGRSVGLGANTEGVESLGLLNLSPREIEQAEHLLGQIHGLFQDAQKSSQRYEQRAKPGDQSLVTHNSETDLERVPAFLHQKMRDLAIRRQGRTKLRGKIRWALYEQKKFSRLVEDIDDLVKSLVDLFPAAAPVQQQLCESELFEVTTPGSLSFLKEAISEHDSHLREGIARAISLSQTNNTYNMTFSGTNNSGVQLGHNSGTFTWVQSGKCS